MISTTSTAALLSSLCYLGDVQRAAAASNGYGYAFALDFDSPLVWPDLPYDTASPSSRYPEDDRAIILRTLGDAGSIVGSRAPRAMLFVNTHLDSALIRRSDAIVGASSSSNRECVGHCLLTNLHIPADRVFVCMEALVHESIHQYLYRIERAQGNFCDLADAGRYRSPWSANRIPLHSLIHASLVWFGILTLWCQLAQTVSARDESDFIRERVARVMFGFTFVRDVMAGLAFPRRSVQAAILELIEQFGEIAAITQARALGGGTLRDRLLNTANDTWVPDLTRGLARIASLGNNPASS